MESLTETLRPCVTVDLGYEDMRRTTTHSITTGLNWGTKYWFRVIVVKTGYDDSAPSESVSLTLKTGNVD